MIGVGLCVGLLTLFRARGRLPRALVREPAWGSYAVSMTHIFLSVQFLLIGIVAPSATVLHGSTFSRTAVETLAQADALLDKTGTVALGRPQTTAVARLNGMSAHDLPALAGTAERDSEHPLAQAVRRAAQETGVSIGVLERFEAVPGQGVRAVVDGQAIVVGSRRMVESALHAMPTPALDALEAQGITLLYVARDGEAVGVLAATDIPRPGVGQALDEARRLGIRQVELLTGDNERTAGALAERLGIGYRAGLLPEDKIRIVRDYQARGHTVVMVGDGVNDAPALAQADVGIAMGVAGTDIAIEAAHIALLRDDWRLVPEALAIAQRTMRVVGLNIGFTAVYNLAGLSLAAFGILPPILAAAAQALPDLGILTNSARLLRLGDR